MAIKCSSKAYSGTIRRQENLSNVGPSYGKFNHLVQGFERHVETLVPLCLAPPLVVILLPLWGEQTLSTTYSRHAVLQHYLPKAVGPWTNISETVRLHTSFFFVSTGTRFFVTAGESCLTRPEIKPSRNSCTSSQKHTHQKTSLWKLPLVNW